MQPHLHGSCHECSINISRRRTCRSCSCKSCREFNLPNASGAFFQLVSRPMQRFEWFCVDPQRSHTARNQENGGKLETAHASSGAYSRETHMPSSSRQVLRASATMHCRLEGYTLSLKRHESVMRGKPRCGRLMWLFTYHLGEV